MPNTMLHCGPLVEGLERDLGLWTESVARALDVERRTVERGRFPHPSPLPGAGEGKTRERLAALLVLRDRLLELFGTSEATQEWLRAPSRYLGGFIPLEAIKAGRLDRVHADLDGLAAGVYR